MDENLPSMPNRYSTKAMNRALEAGLGEAPSRPVVLDRWSQHTAICPTSQDVVRNATLLFRAAVSVFSVAAFATGAALSCAVRSAAPGELLLAVAGCMQTEKAWLAAAAVSGALAALCRRLVSEFSFRYTEDHRDKDLRGIPNVYPDAMARAG